MIMDLKDVHCYFRCITEFAQNGCFRIIKICKEISNSRPLRRCFLVTSIKKDLIFRNNMRIPNINQL